MMGIDTSMDAIITEILVRRLISKQYLTEEEGDEVMKRLREENHDKQKDKPDAA